MADITKNVRAYLLAQAGVQTYLGTTRMDPDVLPQSNRDGSRLTLPYATIDHLGAEEYPHLAGSVGGQNSTVVIDVYASTRTAANAAVLAIRDECQAFRGTMDSINIHQAFTRTQSARVEFETDGDSHSKRYVASIEIDLVHAESATTT